MTTLVHAGGTELLQKDVMVNYVRHACLTCHVTTSANRVQLKAK